MYDRANRKPKTERPAAAPTPAAASVQRASAPAPHHALPASVGIGPPNRTGLPDGLKTGIETLSGLAMDDVRVHRGSSRPAAIQAHAYTQGSEIHLAPGQERHLPHEAWHVVQQKQGRVTPTLDLNGTSINDDAGLEGEADRMGPRAERAGAAPQGAAQPVQRAGIAAPVVQRSVLHLQDEEGDFVYYSDLEIVARGKRVTTFTSREEAQKFDDKLASNPTLLSKAITTSQDRARRVPTPYGHLNTDVTAKVRHQEQGPHSLSFIAFEERLQHRLAKGQYLELLDQVETPERAISLMKSEYGLGDDSDVLKRYALDYRSLYAEFMRLLKGGGDHGVDSLFHLVARKLLQLHPYTTYNGPKSTNRGEDRHGILGSNTLDSKAKYKSSLEYETYLQTRGDIFHSSDEEEEPQKPKKGGTPYVFSSIAPRDRRYSRKAREELKSKKKRKPEVSSSSKKGSDTDEGSSSDSGSEKHTKKKPRDAKAVASEDTVTYYSHKFNPNTVGIRDGGECFWDTMRHYGFTETQLANAAGESGQTVDVAVDARDVAAFVDALNEEVVETIWVRLVTYDLKTLKFQSYLDVGDGDDQVYVALFMDGDEGHYVPELK